MGGIHVLLAIVPLIAIIFAAILVFFYLLWKHHEVMIMIKMSTYSPPSFDIRLFSLFAGIILVAVGAILSVMFYLIRGLSYVLLGGLIPLAVGLGMLAFCIVKSRQEKKHLKLEDNNNED